MIFVLILATILRLINLNQSLWLDEATTALASKMSLYDFFTQFMMGDFHPPLYYLIVKYWTLLFGNGEVSLRIPSVIFGLVTIFVVYMIAKEIKLKNSLIPALFLATSGLHIYYSQEARMYSLATFLVTVAVYCYIKKQWVYFSIVTVFLFLSDYVSMIIVPVLFLYQLITRRNDIKKYVLSLIPVIFTFLVWWPTFQKQLMNGLSLKETSLAWWNTLGPVTFKNVALIPTKFLIGRISFENKIIYAFIIIIISAIFIYTIGKAKNKLIWYWFAGSLLLGIILSFFIPTLTFFRYLFILPAFYLLLAESSSKLFVVFVLFVNLLSTYFYLFNTKFHRENWREISKVIGSAKIIYPSLSHREALNYYGLSKQVALIDEIDTQKDNPVWLSRYVVNISDPDDSTRIKLEELGYNWTEEVSLRGVIFWKYTK